MMSALLAHLRKERKEERKEGRQTERDGALGRRV